MLIPYSYITSNLAVSSAGVGQTSMSANADEPIVPLRYRHAIILHALYNWYRDRKDDVRSQEVKAEYTDIMTRIAHDQEVGSVRPQIRPRVGGYKRAAMSPYRRGAGRGYDVGGRFDRLEEWLKMNFPEVKAIAWKVFEEPLGITFDSGATGTPSSSTALFGDGSWKATASGYTTGRRHAYPVQRQTMLFSATFPPEVEQLAAQTLKEPSEDRHGPVRPAHTVAHALYPVPAHLKTPLLLALLKQTETESVLIFTRTKFRAQKLSEQIQRAGFKVTSLHSNRTQGQRQSALKGFRAGHHQIMVATDIAARGLDVESISHVINYDMPDTAERVHPPHWQDGESRTRR